MSARKVVILDGSGENDRDLAPVLGELLEVFRREGSAVETFPLRELKLAHCIGCFNCWLKTPGMCVEDDAGRQVARALIQSEIAVLFTPVTFGGYSPELKKMVDHFVQLASPFFAMDHGEVHHPPRYDRRPRMVTVGVERFPNPHEARVFKTLAGRNAINFHPPGYAVEVVTTGDPPADRRARFEELLTRSDTLPFGEAAASLMPPPLDRATLGQDVPKRALLIVGSPKTTAPSVSNLLGSYLMERLGAEGWQIESLSLRAGLTRKDGEAVLLASVERAGLIVLSFPLYVDSLPYLVTKALAVIAAGRRALIGAPPQRLVAIVQSGFPETFQNSVALAICEEFASQSGIVWAGGLAMGGGGALGEDPLSATKRRGLPVEDVVRALDFTAKVLTENRPVPPEAIRLMARHSVRWMPFPLWRQIYMRLAGKGFEHLAARNGVTRAEMLAQPYAAY